MVRVLNHFPIDMSIKQDAVIGKAEPIEGKPTVIVSEEDSREVKNHVAARRIKLVTDEKSQSLPEYTARKIKVERILRFLVI